MTGTTDGTAEAGWTRTVRNLWARRLIRWTAGICLLHVVLGLLLYEPVLFPGGDNAGYIILGEALRTGAGYVDLHLPGEPLHTKYPPLYPALLGALGWIGGLQLFKLASLGFTTGAVALTAVTARRWFGGAVAVAAALAVAVNPVLLEYSHYVLTEAPFIFLVLASVYACHRGRDGGTWWWVGVGAAVAAFLTRTAGLPLLVAVVLYPLVRRDTARVAVTLVAAVAAAGGWALVQRLGAPDEAGYLAELLMVDPYDPAAGAVDAPGLIRRTAENFWLYISLVLPRTVAGPVLVEGEPGFLFRTGGLALAALAAWGWVQRGLRELGVGEIFLVLYLGMIALWPEVWTDVRFLLPAAPLLLIYGMGGASDLAMRLAPTGSSPGEVSDDGSNGGGSRRAGAVGAGLVAGALVVTGLASAWQLAPERLRCMAEYRADRPCDPPAYASFYAAARWAGENTAPDALFIARKPRLFYLHARRQAMVYPFTAEPSLMISEFEGDGVDYVVVAPLSGTTYRYLIPAVEEHPDRFEPVYHDGSPATWILRFHPHPLTAGKGDPPGNLVRGPAPGTAP